MYPIDAEDFRKVMVDMALFPLPKGVEKVDDLIPQYWNALKDQHIESVKRCAARHMRYGKFFPKPWELRPKDSRPVGEESDTDRARRAAFKKTNIAMWDARLKENPLLTKWQLLQAYVACGEATMDHGSDAFADRMRFARAAGERLLAQGEPPYFAAVLMGEIRSYVGEGMHSPTMELEL